MKGIILEDGSVKGEDDKLYYPMRHGNTMLIVLHSWSRIPIKPHVGKTVVFDVSPSGYGYNFNFESNET